MHANPRVQPPAPKQKSANESSPSIQPSHCLIDTDGDKANPYDLNNLIYGNFRVKQCALSRNPDDQLRSYRIDSLPLFASATLTGNADTMWCEHHVPMQWNLSRYAWPRKSFCQHSSLQLQEAQCACCSTSGYSHILVPLTSIR